MSNNQGQTSGYLGTLPAELRNNIYELVLTSDQPTELTSQKNTFVEPALLRVNQQIRNEALQVYRHSAKYETDSIDRAGYFLTTIAKRKEKLASLEELSIRCPPEDLAQAGTEPVHEEKVVHCLRRTRRTLLAFDHQFKRKGLRRGAIRMQMLVLNKATRLKELVWVDVANIGDFKTQDRSGMRRQKGKAIAVRR